MDGFSPNNDNFHIISRVILVGQQKKVCQELDTRSAVVVVVVDLINVGFTEVVPTAIRRTEDYAFIVLAVLR